MSVFFRTMTLGACLLAAMAVAPRSLAQPAAAKGHAKEKAPPPPPAANARLWVIAPAARGRWTLRIDNEDTHPIRVPADVRLLRFEIEVPLEKHGTKKFKCGAPGALRPDGVSEARALVLQPGQSYIEEFDPHLLCFGKDAAALVPNAVVRSRFGWDPPSKWSKKRPDAPFAVEGIEVPEAVSPLRELTAPTMLLSHAEPPPPKPEPTRKRDGKDPPKDVAKADAAKAEPGKTDAAKADGHKPEAETKPEAAPVDAAAPRLEVTADPWSDAASPRGAAVTVTATNVGLRSMVAALRARMLAFRVEGPDGVVTCDHAPPTHAVPRDMYRTLKPKASVGFTVLLGEVCPRQAFDRVGMYRVTPTLHANESGSEIGLEAFVGTDEADAPAVLRLQSAPEPFYKERPKAVPTPKLEEQPGE